MVEITQHTPFAWIGLSGKGGWVDDRWLVTHWLVGWLVGWVGRKVGGWVGGSFYLPSSSWCALISLAMLSNWAFWMEGTSFSPNHPRTLPFQGWVWKFGTRWTFTKRYLCLFL